MNIECEGHPHDLTWQQEEVQREKKKIFQTTIGNLDSKNWQRNHFFEGNSTVEDLNVFTVFICRQGLEVRWPQY